ncbi:MAG: PTS sugar transporter subunit IIA [Fusobacterium varium]|uniref:PTS sugar transporter subunit IIA n=1 Tax=Fusobacterium varium TaxID=856 RepID=UPI003991B19E
MIYFVMVTHGKFAEGIKNSIEIVLGKFKNLECLSCYTEENFNLDREIDKILTKHKDKQIIAITDIFGGSVNNAFMEKTALNPNLYVVCGLNLSLMLVLLGEYEEYETADELIKDAIANSSDAVKYCNLELEKNEKIEDEDF